MLLNEELIEGSWCNKQYAELARAFYPSLDPNDQKRILEIVDAIPDRYRENWEGRFREHEKREPNEQDHEDLDELLELSDRLLVMFHGQFVYEAKASEADLTEIGLIFIKHNLLGG